MKLSAQLLSELLLSKGYRARAFGCGGRSFERVRLLPKDGGALAPSTLYVCDKLPPIASEADSGADPNVFALAGPPPDCAGASCLSVEGAGDAHALINMIADACDDFGESIAKARLAIWDEGGVEIIISLLSNLIGNPVYVVDSSFKVLAITDDPDMEEMSINWMHAARKGYLSYDVVAGLIRTNELHNIERSTSAVVVESSFFYTPFANYNLRAEGKVQGHLFAVQMYKPITEGDLEIIDLIAPAVMHALLANPRFQSQHGPLYERFVVDWLEGELHDPPYIRRQLDALDFDAASCSVAAIIALSVDSDFMRRHLAQLLEDRQGCRAVSHGTHVVALFQLKRHWEKEGVLRKVRDICRSQQCRAFVSDVQDKLVDTPRAYRQAREAQRICDAMAIDDEVVCYGDVAAYQPYLNFSSPDELDAFCHPAVATLRDHDQAHAMKLLPTLSAYLKNDRDAQATAEQLFIHRNTLSYRLKKILEMCPLDLDDFNTRHRVLESTLIVENYDGIVAHLHARETID